MTNTHAYESRPPSRHRPDWLRESAGRAAVASELHARPVLPLPEPLRIRRAAFLAPRAGNELAALHARVLEFAGLSTAPRQQDQQRHFVYQVGAYTVSFELHNEFATLTWQAPLNDWADWPSEIGIALFAGLELFSATRIDLTDSETITPEALAGFEPTSLSYSEIYEGQAQVATDFRADAQGFTRYEVAAGRCGPLRRGVIARRLLEVETYSNLLLLGLPLARQHTPGIAAAEVELAGILAELGDATTQKDNQEALDNLHALSVRVGRTVEETSFRFAATRAYGDVLRIRLDRLGEVSIGEFTTIDRYLSNRIEPALATCEATEKRLERLTAKLQRATELLDARITLGLQRQNQAVLDTIARTAQSQYRLQTTVEGLSIIAISYYALGILGYVFDGLSHALPFSKSEAVALVAPLVVLCVWLGLRRIRKGH